MVNLFYFLITHSMKSSKGEILDHATITFLKELRQKCSSQSSVIRVFAKVTIFTNSSRRPPCYFQEPFSTLSVGHEVFVEVLGYGVPFVAEECMVSFVGRRWRRRDFVGRNGLDQDDAAASIAYPCNFSQPGYFRRLVSKV